MIIIISLAIATVAFLLAAITLDDFEEVFGACYAITGLFLIGFLVSIPVERHDIRRKISAFETLQKTIDGFDKETKVANGIKILEYNEWLEKEKYSNKTVFDIYIPDEIENLEPLK